MRRLLVGLLLLGMGCDHGGGGSDGGLPDGSGAWSGSAGSSGSTAAPPGVTNPGGLVDEDAIAQYARETCDTYERCGPDIYPDRETCLDTTSCSLRSLLMGTALTRGELLACSHEFKSVACGTMPALPGACADLVTAFASALGEVAGCDGALCAEGMYCNRNDDHCPFCAPYAEVGEPCLDTRCERGSYCSTDTLNCEREMPCDSASECTRPSFGSDGWLTCRNGICTQPVDVGGSCVQGADCIPYLRCQDGLCAERGRAGDACTGHQDCYPYTSCIRGTCTEACGFQREGGPCIHDLYCRDSYCDEATSACVATKPAGAPCTRSAECGDGSFCDAATAACADKLQDGAPCTLDDECTSELCSGLLCQQPTCTD